MGGGAQGAGSAAGGAASTATMQDLLQQMQRQQMWNQVGQGFQSAGAIVGKQQPYTQMGGGGGGGLGGGAIAPPSAQGAQLLGALFPQGTGGGAGGIDPQQLAMILQRLGYGG